MSVNPSVAVDPISSDLSGVSVAGSLLLLATLHWGCAVNDWGLVRVRHAENVTARMVRLETWGAHLVTGANDAGVTLGHSSRTYVFAIDGAAATISIGTITGENRAARMHAADCNPCPALTSLGSPILRITRSTGLALDANAGRVGIALGLRQRAALQLPSNEIVVVSVRYDSSDDAAPEVSIGKGVQR
jgi:hypothetical protein